MIATISPVRVVIVGAGPAGLTAAAHLVKRGPPSHDDSGTADRFAADLERFPEQRD